MELTAIFSLFIVYTVFGDNTDWKRIAKDELRKSLDRKTNVNKAKNVIIFIGDGMGVSTVTAARILRGQKKGYNGEETVLAFETFPHVGLSKTYCNDYQTPDSASTATALLCGEKTNWYTVGLDHTAIKGNCSHQHGREITCIPDWFHEQGRSVGLVTTARITHATPAAAYAKSADRFWEGDVNTEKIEGGCKDIAQQLVRDNPHIKVLFGGGRRYFLPNTTEDPDVGFGSAAYQRRDGVDLIKEWKRDKDMRSVRGEYVWNKQQFDNIDISNTEYALGLFNTDHMEHILDTQKGKEPTLAEMTEKAIKLLQKNEKGYFLLVEETHIDKAHHRNNAKRALWGVLQLEDAVKKAMEMTDEEDTLLIVTADHSHVFNIVGYPKRGRDIFGVVELTDPRAAPKDGILWTTLLYGIGPGYDWGKRVDNRIVNTTDKDFVQAAAAPRGLETHGGEDVAIYARGPMSHLIDGVHEQHYIAHMMAYASCVGDNKGHCDVTQTNGDTKTMMSFNLLTFVSFWSLVSQPNNILNFQ